MGSYRSAYEEYYKNINNTEKGRKDKNRYSILGRKVDNSFSPKYGANVKNNGTMINVLIKRATKELTGATILLLFFFGLKYIPSTQVQEMHNNCKQLLNQNFNYNEYIETLNTIQIGNIKGRDFKMGNFTFDDLKIENLKSRTSNFMEYLKNNSNAQN